MSEQKPIEDMLVAQVLTLATTLKMAREASGHVRSTSDYVDEAARLIRDKRAAVLRAMRGTPES